MFGSCSWRTEIPRLRLDERTKQLLHSTQLGPTCQKPIKVSPNKTLTPPPSGQPHTPTCSRRCHPPRAVLQPGSPRRLPRAGASLRPIPAGRRRPAWPRPPTPLVDGAWLGASSCSTRRGLAASSFSTGCGLVAIHLIVRLGPGRPFTPLSAPAPTDHSPRRSSPPTILCGRRHALSPPSSSNLGGRRCSAALLQRSSGKTMTVEERAAT